jgi:predicted nucleotidyltransferase
MNSWRPYKISMQSTYDRIYFYKITEKQKACIVDELKAFLADREPIKLAWLFGSITRRDSIRDVDVAIYADPELPFKQFLRLGAEIEGLIRMPADLVEVNQVPPTLKNNILKNGLLIKGTRIQQKELLEK